MPSSYIHQAVTRYALSFADGVPGDHSGLINNYCLYPDDYFSGKPEYVPYNFFTDGVQFHYLPDTPYNELYRYWSAEGGRVHRTMPYVNENFIHARAGFEFFLTHIVEEFRAGNMEEGKKYLGSLLHMLEDSTFGLHSIEGPGGMDLFVLDRLMESEELPTMFATRIDAEGLKLTPSPYTPRQLGGCVGEMIMRLYREYYRRTCESRKCTFQYILNVRDKNESANQSLVQRLLDTTVQLCADVIYSLKHIAEGTAIVAGPCPLTALEPYEFPFGGYGMYRFRGYERDRVLFADGTMKQIDGVSFGSHHEGALRYWIAPGVFRKFTAELKLYAPENSMGEAEITIRNHGTVIQKIVLNAQKNTFELDITEPCEDFSFEMLSQPLCGVIAIENGRFYRT